jgi:hypothetical protein
MSSFGRLEIYWPDGPVESYILQKDTIALGRSSGNDLVVDRNGVSRYHAKLTFTAEMASLTDLDSVNGVYVDGVLINASEERELRGGEEIQIADVRMVYFPPTVPDDTVPSPTADTTRLVETEHLTVKVTGPEMVVTPGAHTQAEILVESTSETTRRYQIHVEGVPKDWVRLERNEFELNPGEQMFFHASFKPLRRSESHPGDYPLTFVVNPKDNPEAKTSVESMLTVGSFSGYGVLMGTSISKGKQPFRMHIHNQGNDDLTVSFRGVDPKNALIFDIDPQRVTLKGGERRSVFGKVRLRSNALFGSPQQHRYDIITLAEDRSGFQAPISGTYIGQPRLPAWAATVAIPLVAIVAILLVILGVALLGEDEVVPAIVIFEAGEEVALGDPLIVNWEVLDARSISLSYARADQPPQEIIIQEPPVSDTYQIALDQTGVYTINFTVENSGGTQADIAVVRVIPVVNNLSAEPDTLIQNVTQNIEVNWSVAGAQVADGRPLISLESQELSVIQGSGLREEASETFAVRPTGEVAVTVRVVGNDGTENSRTLNLAVEAPRCTLANPSAIIYAGPGQVYDALMTIDQQGTVVNPLARNTEDTWLQINHEDDLAWVRIADFACEGFLTAQLDPVVDIPPTPSPTPSPTPTDTPTPSPSATLTDTPPPSRTPLPTRTQRPTATEEP